MIVDCAAYRDGRRCGGRLSLDEARAFLGQRGTLVWIGLRMPSEQELLDVQSSFELDGATAEDLDLQEAASPHQQLLLERVALGELR
jgi:magnesium transporter